MFILMTLLAGCGGADHSAASPTATSTNQSVTVQNCGRTLTFTKVPGRVISTGQTTTDILLTLGLGDRIIGTYYKQLYQPVPQFTSAYSRIRDLGGNMATSTPSKEVVLSAKPDFVFSSYFSGDFLSSYGMATVDQLTSQGAQVYGMSSECSVDATKTQVTDIYTDINNIGKIFHVEERARQVVTDMQNRIQATQQRLKGLPLVPAMATPMTTGPDSSGSLTVVGGGIYTDVLRLAGAKNVFSDQSKAYPMVSKEALANQRPEAYIIVQYVGFPVDPIISYLYKTFPNAPASQKHQALIVEANYWNAGIFLPDVIEQIARKIHPEAFASS